jgi:hypothetical protein
MDFSNEVNGVATLYYQRKTKPFWMIKSHVLMNLMMHEKPCKHRIIGRNDVLHVVKKISLPFELVSCSSVPKSAISYRESSAAETNCSTIVFFSLVYQGTA